MDSTAEARIEAARHLRALGLTYRRIGAAIGVSHATARRYAPGPRGDRVGEGETPPTAPGEVPDPPVPSGGVPSGPPVGEGETPPTARAPDATAAGPMRGGALADWIGRLTLPDGEPFELMPWERDFCRLLETETGDVALSVARGNGKTALVAGIATAAVHPDGPLHRRQALTVLVAHDFRQAGIAFGDVRDMLFPDRQPGEAWRVQDSSNARRIEHRPTGAAVEVVSSNPRRAHGLRPLLVLADEPAQWEDGTSGKMLAALQTGLGKLPGSRMIALGTRPAVPDHWFERMLEEGPALVFAAAPDADPAHEGAWEQANPSLPWMPHLRDRIALEAAKTGEPSALARFRALRLNAGVADTAAAVLISPEAWARVESADPAPREGMPVYGVDLGGSAASSAIAAVWRTGRVEVFAAFPASKSLAERGRADNVSGTAMPADAAATWGRSGTGRPGGTSGPRRPAADCTRRRARPTCRCGRWGWPGSSLSGAPCAGRAGRMRRNAPSGRGSGAFGRRGGSRGCGGRCGGATGGGVAAAAFPSGGRPCIARPVMSATGTRRTGGPFAGAATPTRWPPNGSGARGKRRGGGNSSRTRRRTAATRLRSPSTRC